MTEALQNVYVGLLTWFSQRDGARYLVFNVC